jgi:hypothetical protein
VLDIVAEGDKVAMLDRCGGTHRGEFFELPGTGDRIEWMAIHFYTIRDGKVLEDATMTDARYRAKPHEGGGGRGAEMAESQRVHTKGDGGRSE